MWLFITGRFPTKKRRWQSDVLIKFPPPNELSPENYQLIYEPSIDFSLIQPESQRLSKIFFPRKNNYFTKKAFLFVPLNLEDSRGKFKFFSSLRIATQHSNRIKRAANSQKQTKAPIIVEFFRLLLSENFFTDFCLSMIPSTDSAIDQQNRFFTQQKRNSVCSIYSDSLEQRTRPVDLVNKKKARKTFFFGFC